MGQGLEVRPGTARWCTTILSMVPQARTAAVRLPAGPGMGFRPVKAAVSEEGDTKRPRGRLFLVAAHRPGHRRFALARATRLRPGRSDSHPRGSKLVVRCTATNGKATTDRTRIGFIFAKAAEDWMRLGTLVNGTLHSGGRATTRSPPRWRRSPTEQASAATRTARQELEYGHVSDAIGVPNVPVISTGRPTTCCRAVEAPGGTKIRAVAHYDNSTANKSNPIEAEVWWGDQTWVEMMFTGRLGAGRRRAGAVIWRRWGVSRFLAQGSGLKRNYWVPDGLRGPFSFPSRLPRTIR